MEAIEKKTQIMTLADLANAVSERRAVSVPANPLWNKPRPAAFIFNLPGSVIYTLINTGMFIYEKVKKPMGFRR